MTAEELALMGYQPGQTSSLDLNAAQSSVTPQDLQQFYAMAGNPQAGAPDVSQLNPQPTFIDPAVLNSLSALQSQYSSDPNGFTSDSSGPPPLPLPGNPGQAMPATTEATAGQMGVAGNPATNPYTPDGTADQTQGGVTQQQALQPQPQQPKLTPWQQYLTERGIGPNSVVDMASHRELLKGFNAMQIKQLEMADPEKQLKLQQMQHEISTQGMKDQHLQAQTAESQSKVVAGEVAKSQAQQTVTDQLSQLQTQKQNLDAVIAHPALPAMTGVPGQYNPGITDEQRNLAARLDQLMGQGLINGINLIKTEAANPNGTLGMRITQQEAMAVTNAAQRLQRYQSAASFKSSAQELSDFLQKAIDAKQKQLASLPAPNTGLMQKNNYTPSSGSVSSSSSSSASDASVRVIKTKSGRGTFQSLGNGQWIQIQ